MPQGTFVPSHCWSFSPKQRALFYTWIHFIQQLAVFFKHIFTARLTTDLLCALLLTDSKCSHAPKQFDPAPFFFFQWERFNLETFTVLGYIWSCERCRRIKSGGDRERKAHKTSEAFGEFLEHHGEKGASVRDGGIKSNYLSVEFLTLFFMCLSFEILWDLCAVAFVKETELNTGSFCCQTLNGRVASEGNQLVSRGFSA